MHTTKASQSASPLRHLSYPTWILRFFRVRFDEILGATDVHEVKEAFEYRSSCRDQRIYVRPARPPC